MLPKTSPHRSSTQQVNEEKVGETVSPETAPVVYYDSTPPPLTFPMDGSLSGRKLLLRPTDPQTISNLPNRIAQL